MSSITHQVTLYVAVTDEAAVLEAGAQHLLETKSCETIEAAREEIGDDVSTALRYLLDPGSLAVPGLEIHDSSCDSAAI